MTKTVFKILLGLMFGCGAIVAHTPLIIPIINADFESTAITNGTPITDPPGCGVAQHFDTILGWTFLHIIPGSGGGVAAWKCDDGMPNSNVAFLGYGESMYQVTGEKARVGTYVLQFYTANWFYPYPADWKAELFQAKLDPNGSILDTNGNTWTLSPAPFCSDSGWALGDMKQKTVVCDMPGYFLQTTSPDPLSVGGQNPSGYIVVYFTSGVSNPALGGHSGWTVLIDNVSLSFSPQ